MRRVAEGERRPFGWGYVDYDWLWDGYRIAPMPFNWIIRWAVKFERWASKKSFKPLTVEELENHHRVLEHIGRVKYGIDLEAYNRGYDKGHTAGWEAHTRFILDQLDKIGDE